MSLAAVNDLRQFSHRNTTAAGTLAFSYGAAYLSALSSVGVLYVLGIFDVGFLSPESLAVKLVNYVGFLLS